MRTFIVEQLVVSGCGFADADRIAFSASRGGCDWHEAERMLDEGCPAATVVEILT